MTSDDVLVEVAPAGDGGLALVADDGQGALVGLLGVDVEHDVEDDDGAQVAHALLGDAQQLAAVLAELDALDGGREVPGLEAPARLDLPQPDRVVGAAARDERRRRVHVHRPDRPLVALVRPQPLAVVREPRADLLVLGRREEEVSVRVVSIEWGCAWLVRIFAVFRLLSPSLSPFPVGPMCMYVCVRGCAGVGDISSSFIAGHFYHEGRVMYLIWVKARSYNTVSKKRSYIFS